MIHTQPAALRLVTLSGGRKLLAGKIETSIPAGSIVLLTRDPGSDQYTLHAARPDTSDQHDPSTLATFISPEDVDAIETAHAVAVALPTAKPKRKTRKRKDATAKA